ncbi:MAG TPA: YigZ family protein [Actinomycetaceae bacterium]|nr:YigZ family protein [Actinomycetaceae bacterium]
MDTPRHRPMRGSVTTREIEIRRSRFIATIAAADDEEAARAVIAEARATYPDARHHCSAFIVEVPGAQDIERSSDDGEPPGTAGRPMLEVLRGSGLTGVAAVVTRYFGGVKLGTGGLVRAYSDAVTRALEGVPRVRVEQREIRTVALPHAEAGRIRAELESRGFDVVGAAYGTEAVFTFATADPAGLEEALAALTSGTAASKPAGRREVEVRVRAQ